MTAKRNESKPSIPVIVALITLTGTLFAAIIGIFPDVVEINSKQEYTVTPVTFTRYDDVLNLFSIEYPSSFYVVSRKITVSEISVMFAPTQDDKELEFLAVGSYPGDADLALGKLNAIIQMATDNPDLDIKDLLVSSKKINNGYYMHVQRVGENGMPSHTHVFYEARDNIVTYVFYGREGDPVFDDSVIEHIFYSFNWSPIEIAIQFQ